MDKIRLARTLVDIVNIKFGFDLCGGQRILHKFSEMYKRGPYAFKGKNLIEGE